MIALLDNWRVVDGRTKETTAPETYARTLSGKVTSHDHIADGRSVIISIPKLYDPDSKIFTTRSGQLYSLGKPSHEYEYLFPNSLERIHESLSRLPIRY